MAAPITQKMAVDVEGSFVVFLIGIRINKFWKIHKWLPVFRAMPRMLEELSNDPKSGLLSYRFQPGLRNFMVVQYWRSVEHLQSYARDQNRLHLPAWAAFAKNVGSSGDVGIWHETYCVNEGAYEAIYQHMPPYGLGTAGQLVPATGRRETAAGRLEKYYNGQNGQNGTGDKTAASVKADQGSSACPAPQTQASAMTS